MLIPHAMPVLIGKSAAIQIVRGSATIGKPTKNQNINLTNTTGTSVNTVQSIRRRGDYLAEESNYNSTYFWKNCPICGRAPALWKRKHGYGFSARCRQTEEGHFLQVNGMTEEEVNTEWNRRTDETEKPV